VAPQQQGATSAEDDLVCAAAAGESRVVESVLSEAVDVNPRDLEGWTPLLWAASLGHQQVVKVLLPAGADPNSANSYGETPLMWACWQGHAEVAITLIGSGADVNARTVVARHRPESWSEHPRLRGAILSAGQTCLNWASQNGNPQIIRALLDADADVNLGDEAGTTPLMRVATAEAAEILLAAGGEVDRHNRDYCTALMYAVEVGNTAVAQVLFDAGAELPLKGKHHRAEKAIREAIYGGHVSTVALLLERGLDVNAPLVMKDNLLGAAVRDGRVELIKFLLARGAVPLNTLDNIGSTPLLDALHHPLETAIIEALLRAGANPNVASSQCTPLMSAAKYIDRTELISLLLKAGADVHGSAPKTKMTPLMIAAMWQNLTAIELLLAAGAAVNDRDSQGKSALTYAIDCLKRDSAEYESIIRRLKHAGAGSSQ
jgi:ankyrin repeat protein